jgi:hypothetical protein
VTPYAVPFSAAAAEKEKAKEVGGLAAGSGWWLMTAGGGWWWLMVAGGGWWWLMVAGALAALCPVAASGSPVSACVEVLRLPGCC